MKPLLQPFPMGGNTQAQVWRYQARFRRPHHFHAEPELNVVWRGTASFLVGERLLAVPSGSVLVLPPGVDHSLVAASSDLEFFAVGFARELLEAYHRQHGRPLTPALACLALPPGQRRRFQEVCEEVARRSNQSTSELPLFALLADAASWSGGEALGARAASVVVRAPTTGRDQLAKQLASNRGDISRAFHHENGVTFREFRNRIRILGFLSQVDSATNNMTRAALRAGFGSYSQCHRIFREVLGVSPRAFVASGLRNEQAAVFEPLQSGAYLRVSSPSPGAPALGSMGSRQGTTP